MNIAGPYVMIIFFTILTIFSSGSNSKPMIENYRYLIEDTSSNYINNNNPPVSVSIEFANESKKSNNFIELDNVNENIDPNWIKSTSKKLYNYAKNNNWDSFLEVVYSSVDAYEDMLTAGLNVALMLSAPPEIIYKLMNDGAEIYPTSLYTRFNEANVDYLLELENLGVDFSMLQPMNFKMIDLTFLTHTHSNVFNFVLERNASDLNQVNEIGLDSLGMAIVNAQINPDKTVYFISTLIQHGAMINSDHKTLLTNLKADSPNLYAEIVAGIPQLTE